MAPAKPITQALNQWLDAQGLRAIEALLPASGGCICDNYTVTTGCGERFFLKTCPSAPAGFFAAEAAGLAALAAASELRIPQVRAQADDYLLLEYIDPGQPHSSYWQRLAEGLASLHQAPVPAFGFSADNFCGTTPQPNPQTDDGYQFFGEHRLRFQGQLAQHSNLLTSADCRALDSVIQGLPQWIPAQPPSLLHGDLWSGNLYCDGAGQPVLIDPACYWGWREADIAMTRLFGALPAAFYQHYQDLAPMPAQWQDRMDLYNLYHLLNHLNLFGHGYLNSVRQVLKRYA